jgi:hypothetical protein
MKKLLLLLPLLLITVGLCSAKEPDLLSLAAVMLPTTTPAQMAAMLGQPAKIEDNKKSKLWHYNLSDGDLVLSWNKKSDQFVKFSFISPQLEKKAFDVRVSKKLKSGKTDLAQTLALLGTPKDMTIKDSKQEVHYAYENSVLRLFFRDRVLVDYTLLGQGVH